MHFVEMGIFQRRLQAKYFDCQEMKKDESQSLLLLLVICNICNIHICINHLYLSVKPTSTFAIPT